MNQNYSIIFFDGVCNLCNGTVDLLISIDHRRVFRYSPLQGEEVKKYNLDIDPNDLDTFYLLDEGIIYKKAQAWKIILKRLGGIWLVPFLLFSLVPNSIANFAYDHVAKNRYRFFGKRDTCRLPTPEERNLFLD
ncbi:MAG: DCC1-like thiol-disulfide oxidoreductase family protein [Bdellovibrionales bacterium]